jgi:2'-5' RNA ligase
MDHSKKRLFIAINLPETIKKQINKELREIRYDFTNDIRFLKPENWHITLVFLGYQPVEKVPGIVQAMKITTGDFSKFEIELSNLTYGPLGKAPRMIWLNGSPETSKKLSKIKSVLEKNLEEKGVNFPRDYPNFQTHITLARFPAVAKGKAAELPKIDKNLSWHFAVKSLELMESHLARTGAEYIQLISFNFNE